MTHDQAVRRALAHLPVSTAVEYARAVAQHRTTDAHSILASLDDAGRRALTLRLIALGAACTAALNDLATTMKDNT